MKIISQLKQNIELLTIKNSNERELSIQIHIKVTYGRPYTGVCMIINLITNQIRFGIKSSRL